MGKVRREWSVEEFNNWCDASDEEREIAEAAGEEGGPRLSLLGDPDTAAIGGGTDWLGDRPAEPKAAAVPFQPEPSRNRLSGWSAHRQQLFIEALAETGTVHLAARRAGLSARSAYQLRLRARRPSPRPGTRPSSWRSGGSPPSPSTARSTAGLSRYTRTASWWPSGGCRASGC
jgi:hypothetical protein